MLTDAMIVKLSECISSEEELIKFGTVGLGLKAFTVKRQINNCLRNLTTATHNLVMDWLKAKDNRFVAYDELEKALEAAELKELIEEALQ